MSTEIRYSKRDRKFMKFLDFPNEIIIEIFLFCMPWEWQRRGYTFPSARTAPILLTHICSSWRNIVHNTPELWSGLNVSYAMHADLWHRISQKNILKRLDHITAQLDLWTRLRIRSGQHLDLWCHFHPPYSVEHIETPTWHTIMSGIIDDTLCHIRKFCLDVKEYPYLNLLARNDYFLPVLETLDLRMEDMDAQLATHNGTSLPITTFCNAPNLRKVILNYNYEDTPMFPILQLPWKQLTHLVILHTCSVAYFVFLAKECLALELLFLTLNCDGESMPTEGAVVMPSLRKLEVIFNSVSLCTLDIFSFLYLPVLEQCDLHSEPGPNYSLTWHPSSGLDHMCQQFGNLRCLQLGYMNISASMLIDVLRKTPHLVDLTVDSELVSYVSFIHALTFHNDDNPNGILVPKLEHLSLYVDLHWRNRPRPHTDDPNFPFQNTDLLAMLVSRSGVKQPVGGQHSRAPVPLKTMYVGVERSYANPGLDVDVLVGQVADLHLDTKFTLDIEPSTIWMIMPVETW